MTQSECYVIKNANLFMPVHDATWVKNDLTINKGFFTKTPSKYNTINGNSYWITPGLIDCHVHICGETNTTLAKTFRFDEPHDQSIQRAIKNTISCLESGVTTICDMGNYRRRAFDVRRYVSDKKLMSPRIYTCGNLITGIDGHGKELGVETSEEDLIKAIYQEIAAGADFIKIINDPIYFSIDTLKKAVDYVHKSGLRVSCHAYTEEAITIATLASVDTIEHGCGCFSRENGANFNEHIPCADTFLVPTCVAAQDVVSCPEKALVGMDDCTVDFFQKWWVMLNANLPLSIQSKSKIGVGTDSGFPPTYFGTSAWREMNILHSFGMTKKDCLLASTKINAQILGADNLGTLDNEAHADFLVFSENPLAEDVFTLKNMVSVFVSGNCVYGVDILNNRSFE